MPERLGWPGRWWDGELWDDGELPTHFYPMFLNERGQGPCTEDEAFRVVCWCSFEGCVGIQDQFGFPRKATQGDRGL